MIKGSVRGGQIFLHNLRMLKQIALASFKYSLIICIIIICILNQKQINNYDWRAFISFERIKLLDYFDFNIGRSHKKDPYIKIDADRGAYELRHSYALKDKYLLNNERQVFAYLAEQTKLTFLLASILYLLIFFIWGYIGYRYKAVVTSHGDEILDYKQVINYLKKHDLISDLKLGPIPLVKNSETKHILVMGSTGSGKTNCFHVILRQVRAKQQPAIVFDTDGAMIARYYDASRGDIIINPLDARGFTWDIWDEMVDPHYISIIANSVFAGKGSSHDEMWNNTAKQVFKDAIEYLIEINNLSTDELYRILAIIPLKEIHKKLKGRPSEALLDPASERTAQSIRTNVIAFIDWLKLLSNIKEGYSTREWIEGVNKAKRGWLFVSCPRDMISEFQPVFASIFELALLRIMRLGEDKNRRIWLVMDELPINGKIPSLSTAASQIRKYGGCILSGLQLINQLIEIYGFHVAKTIISQFNTKVIFRTDDIDTAKVISQLAGNKETKEVNESQSYGSHEMRDSVSISEQHRVRQVIQSSDLAKLGDLEVFVKLPAPGLQFAKIKMDYIKDQDRNKAYIERPLKRKSVLINTLENIVMDNQVLEEADNEAI